MLALEASLGAIARLLRDQPEEELWRYAIATDAETYLTTDQIRDLITRDDIPPGSFAQPPIVRAEDGKVKLHIPLRDEAKYPFDHRTIVVDEALIAKRLNVPMPIGVHNLESFARREADLIARRAVAQHNAVSTDHFIGIDDPARSGLPDVITLKEI